MMRIAAGVEIIALLLNGVLAVVWFLSLILVLVGVLWAALGVLLLVQVGVIAYVFMRGATPVGLISPAIGLFCSLCNFNFVAFGLELVVGVIMVAALVARQSEPEPGMV